MMTDIESLSASLVREYLSRKGLKRSLRVLDDEFPREENSVRNRVVLAKELNIEKLLRLNKQELEFPLRTMIEVMVKFFVSEKHMKRADQNQKKEHHSRRQPSDIIKDTKSDNGISITWPSDTALGLSDKRSVENVGKTRDRKALVDSESMTRNMGYKPVIPLEQNTSALGLEEGSQGLSQARGSMKPLSDGRLMKKVKGSSIQSTMDKPRKQKSKKPIDLTSNGDLFSASDFDLGSRSKIESKTVLEKTNLRAKQEVLPVEKEHSTYIRAEETRKSDIKKKKSVKPTSDILVFDDLDSDLSDDNCDIRVGLPTNSLLSKLHESANSITLEIATSLKTLVFGSASKSFNSEWKSQSFSFCDLPDLEYGIVQIKGGPCGILAAMQATVLKLLLFTKDKQRVDARRPPNPSVSERMNALTGSIAEILWRAGSGNSASVVMPSIKEKFLGGGRYRSDGVTETLTIYSFTVFDNMRAFISQNISQFESESRSGCIIFLYSLVFSRTIECIKDDMDERNSTLIGAHGYCTQELVNLCLTGKAVSNVFDGNMELDSGGNEKSLLKGIGKQSDIGLLSLFEHYESCTVGENYKNPKYPIWVVCSESHFSTLFSVEERLLQDRKLQRRFDLYYYDGLARQDEEIRLTIDARGPPVQTTDDLIPPLELCICTKWKNAVINWNQTEPIL